jgi:hypothetical protein
LKLSSEKPNDGREFALCSAGLHNTSVFEIFYEIEESDLVLDGKTRNAIASNSILEPLIIQAGTTTYFRFASIENVALGPIGEGRMMLRVKYGKKASRLTRTIKVTAEPIVGLMHDPGTGKLIGIMSSLRYREIRYT